MAKMTELMKLQAVAGEARYGIEELFIDESSGRVAYMALKSRKRGDDTEVLVSTSRAGAPEIESGTWPLDISPERIAEAPRWVEPDDDGGERVALPLDAWPPLIVGPFGNTTSPLMFHAQLRAVVDGGTPADAAVADDQDEGAKPHGAAEDEAGEGGTQEDEVSQRPTAREATGHRGGRLERASVRIGGEAFGRDGALGRIADLETDAAGRSITHLILKVEDGTHRRPWSDLRHMAREGTHSVLSVGRDDLGPSA